MNERTAARFHSSATRTQSRNRSQIGERMRSISRTTLLYAWVVMAGTTRPGGLDYDKARGLAHTRPSLVHS